MSSQKKKDKITVQDVKGGDPATDETIGHASPSGEHAAGTPSFDIDSVPIDRIGPLTGQLLEQRYLIKEKIGAGGMGVVYRAEHTLMRKEMAVKVLLPEFGSIEGIKKRLGADLLSRRQRAAISVS